MSGTQIPDQKTAKNNAEIIDRLEKIELLLANLESTEKRSLLEGTDKKIPRNASFYRKYIRKAVDSEIAYFAITVTAITMIWFGIWELLAKHFPYPVFSIALGLFIVWWFDHYES